MTNKKQEIRANDNCRIIQATGDVYIINNPQKFSSEEVVSAVSNVMDNKNNNFARYTETILNEKRAEFKSALYTELKEKPKKILNKICSRFFSSNMLTSIAEAQKSYTKSDSEENLKRLVDLLIKKGSEEPESLKDLLCTRAIEIMPYINEKQLDFLSFLAYKDAIITRDEAPDMQWVYEEYFQHLINFTDSLKLSEANYYYLSQVGLVERTHIRMVGSSMIGNIIGTNRHLYTKGFTKEQFISIVKDEAYLKYTRVCCYDSNLLQMNFVAEEDLRDTAAKDNIPPNIVVEFDKLMNDILQKHQVQKIFDETNPNIGEILKLGAFTDNFRLTPLGTLLAIQNIELKLGNKIQWPFK